MNKSFILSLLMTGFTTFQLPPSTPKVKIIKKAVTHLQSDTKQLLIIQNKSITNNIVFKYPNNVDVKVWHDTMLWISLDKTNWLRFGKNVIQIGVNKNGPNVYFKQEIID